MPTSEKQIYLNVEKTSKVADASADGGYSYPTEYLAVAEDKDGRTKKIPATEVINGNTWYKCDITVPQNQSMDNGPWVHAYICVYDATGASAAEPLYQTVTINNINLMMSSDKLFFEVIQSDVAKSSSVISGQTCYTLREISSMEAEGYTKHVYLCDPTITTAEGLADGPKAAAQKVAEFSSVRNQDIANGKYMWDNNSETTGKKDDNGIIHYTNLDPYTVGHSLNSNLFSLGISKSVLPEKFYVVSGYYDKDNVFHVGRYYYPYWGTDNYDFASGGKWAWSDDDIAIHGGYSDYSNCETTIPPTCYFTLTKDKDVSGDDVDRSYTFFLNSSDVFDGAYEVHPDVNSTENDVTFNDYRKNTNISQWNTHSFGTNSLGVERNKSIAADEGGYYLLSNMVALRPEDNYENQEGVGNSWDPTSQYVPNRKFTKLNLAKDVDAIALKKLKDDHFVDENLTDDVYAYMIVKPQTQWQSMFMAILPDAEYQNFKNGTGNWNNVIRPQVQDAKCATALQGCVFVPRNNTLQALTPSSLFNSEYTQFTLFFNRTQSTYYIMPRESYDLTGPAVVYYNPSQKTYDEGASADQWGNGLYQYHYTAMYRDLKESNDDTYPVYKYTGRFRNSQCITEKGGTVNFTGGWRIRKNQLYTTNYREEYYYKGTDNVDLPVTVHTDYANYKAYADAQKSDYTNIGNTGITTTRPMPSIVPGWTTEAGLHDPKGPDTFFYNHVEKDTPNGSDWDKTRNNQLEFTDNNGATQHTSEDQMRINLNFDLPDGVYTIHFYPNGSAEDGTGKPYYTLEPAQDPASHLPTGTTEKYNFLRTYSAAYNYKIPTDEQGNFTMDAYIATGVTSDNKVVLEKINGEGGIDYLPANTGLIIGYKEDLSTAGIDSTDLVNGIAFASEFSKWQYNSLAHKYPRLELSLCSSTHDVSAAPKYLFEAEKKNLLKPQTYMENGAIVNVAAIPQTVFKEGSTTDVLYRNYVFTLNYDKDENGKRINPRLLFRRVKEYSDASLNKPTPGRAYLSLPAKESGGDKWGDNHSDGLGQSAGATVNTAKAQFLISFDEVATDINSTKKPAVAFSGTGYYTLEGVKVARPTKKGIYIHNGKKIAIK